MRQFLVDEIPHRQMEEIAAYLKERVTSSGLDKIYWLELPPDLLSPVQRDHPNCGPHYLAIELGKDYLKFELLVRSRERLRCDCVNYTTPVQETFLLKFAHALIRDLQLTS